MRCENITPIFRPLFRWLPSAGLPGVEFPSGEIAYWPAALLAILALHSEYCTRSDKLRLRKLYPHSTEEGILPGCWLFSAAIFV